MIFIPEVIGRVIDSLREEGNYISWSNVGTTYTINASNTLEEGEWVFILDTGTELFGFEYTFPIVFTDNLDNMMDVNDALYEADIFGQFQVKNVTPDSFDIVSLTAPPVNGGYKSLEPFYMFGHRLEIANRLLMKDKDKIYKYQKYPLFALRLDIDEDISFDQVHTMDGINIAIVALTDKNYRAHERYTEIVHPILMPLYNDFIDALQKPEFDIMVAGIPEHTKTVRPFWGVSALEGNQGYIFNDPLDAIEITNLNLKIKENNC